MRSEFGNLRESTVREIFLSAVKKNRITRANLADATGYSVMTVGKAADAFVALRMLRQSLSQDCVSGRRSRILSVSGERWIGIYDITSSVYSLHICDLALSSIDTFTYRYNSNYFVDENLHFFLEKSEVFVNRAVDTTMCCGIGVLLPGELDSATDRIINPDMHSIGTLKIRKTFKPYCFGCEPLIGDIRTYSAYSVRRELASGQTTLYVFSDSHETVSCYLHEAVQTEKIRFCRMGIIPVVNGEMFDGLSSTEMGPDKSAQMLARIIFCVYTSVPVDKVIISGYRFSDMNAFSLMISECLGEICNNYGVPAPEVMSEDCSRSGICGICAAIRKCWFDRFIFELN